MATFTLTSVETRDFTDDLGDPTGEKAIVVFYAVPGVPALENHRHIIPFAAVANYQLDNGGGTMEEAVAYFILDLMHAGFEDSGLPTARGVPPTGKQDRMRAKRERLDLLQGHAVELAEKEAEIGLPATQEEMMELVADSMVSPVRTKSASPLDAARKKCRDVHDQTVQGMKVDRTSSGWSELTALASSIEEEIRNERIRQVHARWGRNVRHAAWEVHRKKTRP